MSCDWRIVEYEDRYIEPVRDLLVQLEEYLVSIDADHLDTVGEEYREKMILHDLTEIHENEGKAYIALLDGRVAGLIFGIMRRYAEEDRLDYKCPKSGIITELVVDQHLQHNGIGRDLMDAMESYFLEMGCETVSIDVFAYNDAAASFYEARGYHPRMISMLKRIR